VIIMGQSDVSGLLPTVAGGYTLPADPVGKLLYDQSLIIIGYDIDVTVLPAVILTLAECYVIADIMSGGVEDTNGITSEKIGNSSWNYGTFTGNTGYWTKYQHLISSYLNDDIASICATAVIHEDAEECSSDVIPYWGLSND